MSKDQTPTTLTHGATTLHARLHKHIDEYEQEFQLSKRDMDKSVVDNIEKLREVIDKTVGEAYLLDKFTKAVNSMGTWADFFSLFCEHDLTIKYYMGIVLKQVNKDTVISDLEKKYQIELARNTSLGEQYELQLVQIQSANTRQLQEVEERYKKMMDMQKKQLTSSKQEIQVMKKQLQVMQERMIQGDSHKIASLTQQNVQQMQLITELNSELLRQRNKALVSPVAVPKPYKVALPNGEEKGDPAQLVV